MGAVQLPWLPEAILTTGGGWGVGQAIRGMAVDKSAFPPQVLDVYRRNACKPGAMTAMINYYRANRTGLGRNEPAPVIETPTLMIWGEQDKALGLELTEGYGPLVADFTLERLPGVSHWVQQEAPEQVNARLLTWLSTLPLRSGHDPSPSMGEGQGWG